MTSKLDSAVTALHDALDSYTRRTGVYVGHGVVHQEGPIVLDGWVDENTHRIAEALLQAGWQPPR